MAQPPRTQAVRTTLRSKNKDKRHCHKPPCRIHSLEHGVGAVVLRELPTDALRRMPMVRAARETRARVRSVVVAAAAPPPPWPSSPVAVARGACHSTPYCPPRRPRLHSLGWVGGGSLQKKHAWLWGGWIGGVEEFISKRGDSITRYFMSPNHKSMGCGIQGVVGGLNLVKNAIPYADSDKRSQLW